MRIVELPCPVVNAEGFARFGVLPPDEGDGRPTVDLDFALDDGWINYIGHSLAEIEVVDGALRCELLNRHDTHTQTLMPVSGPALMVVAPAGVDFSEDAHFDTVAAFLVPQYTCVHLHRSTWHWGPYPVGASDVRIFNVQGRGYPNDNAVVRFADDHDLVYALQPTV